MSVTLVTEAVSTADVTAPSKPIFTDTTTTETTIRVNWAPSSDDSNVYGYKLYRNDTFELNKDQDFLLRHVFDSLETGESYKIGISAYDSVGNESDINWIDVVTNADSETPSKPTDFVLFNSGSTIDLTWEKSSDNIGVELYYIYLNGNKIGETKNGFYYFFDPVEGEAYTFAISAVDKAGNESELQEGTIELAKALSVSTLNSSY